MHCYVAVLEYFKWQEAIGVTSSSSVSCLNSTTTGATHYPPHNQEIGHIHFPISASYFDRVIGVEVDMEHCRQKVTAFHLPTWPQISDNMLQPCKSPVAIQTGYAY